jgi:diadenosine tetraphosphate (Ap4A) HIT family hydrolase
MSGTCVSCQLNDTGTKLPLRERLYGDENWRVAHGWSSPPGWLVVVSQRHLKSVSELDTAQAASLGLLLRAAAIALHEVLDCEKTYVMLFTEQEGHEHLHFHVVPRMATFGDDDRGARVFRFLNVPESEFLPVDERERLACLLGAIRRELARPAS